MVTDRPGRLQPLTEKILAALPGPRLLWIVAWASVPAVNAGLNLLLDTGERSAVWDQSQLVVVLNYVALSFAIVVTLWGARRIAQRVEALRADAGDALEVDAHQQFRELDDVAAPLAATVVAAAAFGLSALVRDGWLAGLVRGGTWLVVGIALFTFLWTYVSLQLGLDRLGRVTVQPDAPRVDPSLGLRPLGAIAFSGLWMLLIWLVPLVLTGLPDVVGFVIGLVVLAGALGTFFLSLFRLHRQMVDVKKQEVDFARDLYAEAYEPVRTAGTLETLELQRNLLSAADALERRAQAIHEWPIDEGIWARVLTITTSVIAITVGRLILDPLGY